MLPTSVRPGLLAVLALFAPALFTGPVAMAQAPPARDLPPGIRPEGPLDRIDPKIHDIQFAVTISTEIPYHADDPRMARDVENEARRRRTTHPVRQRDVEFGSIIRVQDAPIVMPIVVHGAYHEVLPDSVTAQLWLEGRPDPRLAEHFRLQPGLPFGTSLAVLPIVSFEGKSLRWQVTFRQQSFDIKLDEAGAAALNWPKEWPDFAKDGLAPQLFIESDRPVFKDAVEHVTQGRLRLVPPYLAAKELVRYCLTSVQRTGSNEHRGRSSILHGLRVQGAALTAEFERGNDIDLTCLCVATLRAANIPARPVIGIHEDDDKDKARFIVWGEFYLDGAGWIPFDVDELKGRSLTNLGLRQPWRGFGHIKDLNRRIPLAYHFIPQRAVQAPERPAVWGWDPRGEKGVITAEQRITFAIINRGPGVDDPER